MKTGTKQRRYEAAKEQSSEADIRLRFYFYYSIVNDITL